MVSPREGRRQGDQGERQLVREGKARSGGRGAEDTACARARRCATEASVFGEWTPGISACLASLSPHFSDRPGPSLSLQDRGELSMPP